MSLRRLVRNTLNRGAQVFAVVEGYASGYASVRVAGTGSRLTNLPCTEAMTPGQTVIVDYSAEGRPIVRPYMLEPEVVTPAPLQVVTASQRPDPLEDPKITWEEDEFVSARLTRSSSWIMPIDWFEPISQEEYHASNPVRFDTVLWDTHDMRNSSGTYAGGFRIRVSGHYFMRLTLGYPEIYGGLETRTAIYTFGNSCGWVAKHTRWDQYGVLVATCTSIVSGTVGDIIAPVARAHCPRVEHEAIQPYISMPVDPGGTYPIFEAALIAPVDPGNARATPWWWNIA